MSLAINMRPHQAVAKLVISICAALLVLPMNGYAGNQREEVLADAVRLALVRSITDPRPPHLNFTNENERFEWQRWSDRASRALHSRMPDAMVRSEFLQTLWYEARRAGLSLSLVLGLIEVNGVTHGQPRKQAGAINRMDMPRHWNGSV